MKQAFTHGGLGISFMLLAMSSVWDWHSRQNTQQESVSQQTAATQSGTDDQHSKPARKRKHPPTTKDEAAHHKMHRGQTASAEPRNLPARKMPATIGGNAREHKDSSLRRNYKKTPEDAWASADCEQKKKD